MTTGPQARYHAGSWYVVLAAGAVVMVDDGLTADGLHRLWGLVSGGGGFDEIVGALHALGRVFGVAVPGPEGIRTAVRPGVALLVDRGDGGPPTVDTGVGEASGATAHPAPVLARFIRVGSGAARGAVGDVPLPLVCGVVRADDVEWSPAGAPAPADPGRYAHTVPAHIRPRGAHQAGHDDGGGRPDESTLVPPWMNDPWEPIRPVPGLAELIAPQPAPPTEPVAAGAQPGAAVTEAVAARAGARPVPSTEGTGRPASGEAWAAAARRLESVADLSADLPAPQPGAGPTGADLDGEAAGDPDRGAPPLVHALLCRQRHPNPLQAINCRLCGRELPSASPELVPRPPLGRLRFSTGQQVLLDHNVIVGRAPRAGRITGSDLPRPVRIVGKGLDISRNHLEVRLEGWQVLVVDLGSRNGTLVTAPGRTAQLINAHVPCPITPGTLVELGDDVSLVYEATP